MTSRKKGSCTNVDPSTTSLKLIGAMGVMGGLLTVVAKHLSGNSEFVEGQQDCADPTGESTSNSSTQIATMPSYIRQQLFGASTTGITNGTSSEATESRYNRKQRRSSRNNESSPPPQSANFTMDYLKDVLVTVRVEGKDAFDVGDVKKINATSALLQLTSHIIQIREDMEEAQVHGDMATLVTLSAQVQKLQEELHLKLAAHYDGDDDDDDDSARCDTVNSDEKMKRHGTAGKNNMLSRPLNILKRAVQGGNTPVDSGGVQTRNQKRAKKTHSVQKPKQKPRHQNSRKKKEIKEENHHYLSKCCRVDRGNGIQPMFDP